MIRRLSVVCMLVVSFVRGLHMTTVRDFLLVAAPLAAWGVPMPPIVSPVRVLLKRFRLRYVAYFWESAQAMACPSSVYATSLTDLSPMVPSQERSSSKCSYTAAK